MQRRLTGLKRLSQIDAESTEVMVEASCRCGGRIGVTTRPDSLVSFGCGTRACTLGGACHVELVNGRVAKTLTEEIRY
jgi:hypothetical protein